MLGPMRRRLTLLLLALPSPLTGCFGDGEPPVAGTPARTLRAAQAQAPASVAAGTLARIADGPQARRRLAFVDLRRLRGSELPVPGARVLQRVLGPGARAARADGAARTAVQVGRRVTVLGRPAGVRVLGAPPALAARLERGRPERSAITPAAVSAAQACLGDTMAQTILGPGTMGRDAALGVGLAQSGDPPAGLQLRICGAPRIVRDLHGMERTLARTFRRAGEGRRRARVGEREIGEREIIAATVAADALAPDRLLGLLAGTRALRALSWR